MAHEPEIAQQPRIVRDGHFYIVDLPSRRALEAVKAVDPHAADALWLRWREDGRIRPDLEAERRQGIAPADQHAPSQGHRR